MSKDKKHSDLERKMWKYMSAVEFEISQNRVVDNWD